MNGKSRDSVSVWQQIELRLRDSPAACLLRFEFAAGNSRWASPSTNQRYASRRVAPESKRRFDRCVIIMNGEQLRQLRETLGFTQEQLAEQSAYTRTPWRDGSETSYRFVKAPCDYRVSSSESIWDPWIGSVEPLKSGVRCLKRRAAVYHLSPDAMFCRFHRRIVAGALKRRWWSLARVTRDRAKNLLSKDSDS